MGRLSVDRESLLGPGEGLMRLVGMWQPQEAACRLVPAARGCLTLVSIAFLAVAVVAGLIDWLSSPLVSRALLREDESSRQLPLPLWLPGDVYVSPIYEILYAAQCVALTIASVCSFCTDIFFIHLMQVLGTEFEVLSDNFSAVQKNYEQPARASDRGELSEYQTTKETLVSSCAKIYVDCVSGEQMHRQLGKNIQHHQALLRSLSLLQTTMSVPIFFVLAINIVNLCGNLFISIVLLQRDGNLSKASKALVTIPPLLCETGMFCIFGHALTDQSEKLMQSAFSCGWTESDARLRRSLLLFMTASVRPVEITVGKTTKLSKQTLLQVLNGTYGLLNLLYHFHSSV
ncbi:odorant receptor 83a-like [Schistocerca gregaria]|nr:odorant receptor 83a-like [Schistocerca gregaria]